MLAFRKGIWRTAMKASPAILQVLPQIWCLKRAVDVREMGWGKENGGRLLRNLSDSINKASKTGYPGNKSHATSLNLISHRWCFVWFPPLKFYSRNNFQLAFSSHHTFPGNWIYCGFMNPHLNNLQKLTGFALPSYKKTHHILFHINIVIVTKVVTKLLQMPPITRFCF